MLCYSATEGLFVTPGRSVYHCDGNRIRVATELRSARKDHAKVTTISRGQIWDIQFPPGFLAASGRLWLVPDHFFRS